MPLNIMFNSAAEQDSHSNFINEKNKYINNQASNLPHYNFVEDPYISAPGLAISLLKLFFSKRSTDDQNKLDIDIKKKFNEYFIR